MRSRCVSHTDLSPLFSLPQTEKIIENFSIPQLLIWLVARGFADGIIPGFYINGADFITSLSSFNSETLSGGGRLTRYFDNKTLKEIKAFIKNIENPKTSSSLFSISKEQLKKAFEETYVVTSSLGRLKKKIEDVAKDPSKYPCFAVFQASGYGKSRLISENAKLHFLTLYWCLRPNLSSGYPVQSEMVANRMEALVDVSYRNPISSSSSWLL